MKYKSYAKINIGLNINFKRIDSYHDLTSVMVPITLYDEIDIELIDDDYIDVVCDSAIIKKKDNLVYLVAKYLKDTYKVKKGVKISIVKNIPIGGGLGGGSSNCSTVLKALNELWELNIDESTLLNIGEKFGADVPFCIINKASYVTGIGEQIVPFEFNMDFNVIVVKMPFFVSTKKVFNQLDIRGLPMYNITKVRDAIINNDLERFNKYIGNNMESVTIEMFPEIANVKKLLIEYGCFNSIMSGSGPTVLGFVHGDGESIVNKLRINGYDAYFTQIIK